MITLTPGTVLAPTTEFELSPVLPEPCRILSVDRPSDSVVLIPVEPKACTKEGGANSRLYFRSPRNTRIQLIEENLSTVPPLLRQARITPRRIMLMTDEEIMDRYPPKECGLKSPLIRVRDERWDLIRDLVTSSDLRVLLVPESRDRQIQNHLNNILKIEVSDFQRVRNAILRALFQYWGQGSTKNGLLPWYQNCGNKGQTKKLGHKKLGRPNAPTRQGLGGLEGYTLDDSDKGVINHCWEHFLVRGVTIAAAFRRMGREFYSTLETEENGRLKPVLLPANDRPTQRQFSYWGEVLSKKSASSKQARPNTFEHLERALTGSANDGICAVGQRASIDATTNDTELVSLVSRLDRIGTANRILVADSMFGYIPGFYVGLSPESSMTVELAMLHAMSDKTEWLEALGIEDECPVEDWIPIQFADLLGDNTGLRTEQVQGTFLDTNISRSVQHVPSHRSDLNSIVETRHLMLHRLLDHVLPGTTHGRKTERGERKATETARMTLIENIRENARAVHLYNTKLMPDFELSLEMKKDGVRPTRLDLTRWAIEKGQIAGHLLDISDARAQILPLWEGVFTESGVWLVRSDAGKEKTRIRRLRYVSRHPIVIQNMELARLKGNHYAKFRVDPYGISKIWFLDPTSLELIKLDLTSNDLDLACEASLMDVERIESAEATDRFFNTQLRDQQISEYEARIEETVVQARKEYEEEEKSKGKLTKKAMSANKKENREQERSLLYDGMPIFGRADPGNTVQDIKEDIKEELASPDKAEITNIFHQAYARSCQ